MSNQAVDLTKYLTDLEHVPCNACGADDTQNFSQLERWGLPLTAVMCRRCGLLYINPRPSKESYRELNRADYRHAAVGTDEPSAALFDRQRRHAQQVIIPFFERYGGMRAPRAMLDIGCLQGGTMAGWLDRFPDATAHGVEPVEKAGEWAREHTRAAVTTGLFEDVGLQQRYDAVVFAQALNHTLDPRGNLENIRNLLTDDGLLFISLYDAVSALLNRPLSHMVEVTHPYMFCRETVQYLLAVSGFEIVGYEDRLLDAGQLTRRDIPFLTFPRIKVLARAARELVVPTLSPTAAAIWARMERNMAFYERWQRDVARWYHPRGWRRAVQYLRHA